VKRFVVTHKTLSTSGSVTVTIQEVVGPPLNLDLSDGEDPDEWRLGRQLELDDRVELVAKDGVAHLVVRQ
jgi:hypothetical protein